MLADPTTPASAEPAAAVEAAGATPWIGLVFSTPTPLSANLTRLQAELADAARIAAAAPGGTYFQVHWTHAIDGSGIELHFDDDEYAFLLKQAAVAITGANAKAKVATTNLPAIPDLLRSFYSQDVAAYFEVVALGTIDPALSAEVLSTLAELDPGRPIVDLHPAPSGDAGAVLATAARAAARVDGFDCT